MACTVLGYQEPEICILSIAPDPLNHLKLNVFDVKSFKKYDFENIVDNEVGGMIFTIDSKSEDAGSLIWRLKYKTMSEIEKYTINFEETTGTKWYVVDKKPRKNMEMKQYVLSWKFCCHYKGDKRKAKEERKINFKRYPEISNCQARMEIRIKRDLICHSSDPMMPEYPCEFVLHGTHNHEINPTGPCITLPPLEATLDKLYTSFLNKDRPSVVIHKLSSELIPNDPNPEKNRDARHHPLPTPRQVYYLWEKWSRGAYSRGVEKKSGNKI
ncbi:unnamed protein product, partial [Meganyctiphanes norvegica]